MALLQGMQMQCEAPSADARAAQLMPYHENGEIQTCAPGCIVWDPMFGCA